MSKLMPINAALLVGIAALPVSFLVVYFAVAIVFSLMDTPGESNSLAAIPAIFLGILAAPVCAGLSAWFTFQRLKRRQLRPVPPPPFPSKDPPLPLV